MRTLVPAETLVYLETNDLAAALQPIVDAKPFMEVAKTKPDFSALKGVQLAVAVTGFETSEEKLTDEHSVGRVQPHFVAVADTHVWNYQANAFAEQKLGTFVREIYDSEPRLEKSEKNGGNYFKWTATDGRKAYALVEGSVIYFGNDETAIDKCLAVKRGESDSIAKTGKVATASLKTLASGYVSTDGIAQIANIIGLKYAAEIDEDSEVQSAIAGILPQLMRNTVTDISWRANKTDQGIEDAYSISLLPDISTALNETLIPTDSLVTTYDWHPPDVDGAALYNLRNPQIAWRSILSILQKQTDPGAAKVIPIFAEQLFEPYGVSNPELFLSNSGPLFLVGNYSQDGEKPFVKTYFSAYENVTKSFSADLKLMPKSSLDPEFFWRSDDDEKGALLKKGSLISGEIEAVKRTNEWERKRTPQDTSEWSFRRPTQGKSVVISSARDIDSAAMIVAVLGEKKTEGSSFTINDITETRFTKSGIERRTTSDFGLIGSIISQLAQD